MTKKELLKEIEDIMATNEYIPLDEVIRKNHLRV
jgi:hypothetical protein